MAENDKPDLSRYVPVELPKSPSFIPDRPYPWSPNPYLRSTLPPVSQLQPDTLRQWFNSSQNQQRVLPLPPAANPTINAAAQAAVQNFLTSPPSGGGGVSFTSITSGVNTQAAMVVGSGASLDFTGAGLINATEWAGTPITGAPTLGKIPIGQGTTATWADPVVQGVYPDGSSIATPPVAVVPTKINPVYVGGKGADGNLHGFLTDNTGTFRIAGQDPFQTAQPLQVTGTKELKVADTSLREMLAILITEIRALRFAIVHMVTETGETPDSDFNPESPDIFNFVDVVN